jgi:hypothetical protein
MRANDLLAFLFLFWMLGFDMSVIVGQGLTYLDATQSMAFGTVRWTVRAIRRLLIGMVRCLGMFVWQKIRRW